MVAYFFKFDPGLGTGRRRGGERDLRSRGGKIRAVFILQKAGKLSESGWGARS